MKGLKFIVLIIAMFVLGGCAEVQPLSVVGEKGVLDREIKSEDTLEPLSVESIVKTYERSGFELVTGGKSGNYYTLRKSGITVTIFKGDVNSNLDGIKGTEGWVAKNVYYSEFVNESTKKYHGSLSVDDVTIKVAATDKKAMESTLNRAISTAKKKSS